MSEKKKIAMYGNCFIAAACFVTGISLTRRLLTGDINSGPDGFTGVIFSLLGMLALGNFLFFGLLAIRKIK